MRHLASLDLMVFRVNRERKPAKKCDRREFLQQIQPWPFCQEAVRSLFFSLALEALAGLDLTTGKETALDVAAKTPKYEAGR